MTTDKARGLDLSDSNTPTLANLTAWRGLGFCLGAYRMGIGSLPDGQATTHRANLLQAGYLTFPYHALHEHSGVTPEAQAELLVGAWSESQIRVLMPDIERPDLTAALILPYLRRMRELWPHEILLYTNQSRWHHYFPTEAERRDVFEEFDLTLMVAGYPFDRSDWKVGPDGNQVWQGQLMDAQSIGLRSTPPVLRQPALPQPWSGYEAWQHSGHGRLPGYEHDLDLQVWASSEAELRSHYQSTSGLPPTEPEPPVEVTMPTASVRKLKLGVSHGTGSFDTNKFMAFTTVACLVGDFGIAVEAPADMILLGRQVDGNWFPGGTYNTTRLMVSQPAKAMAKVQYDNLRPHIIANPRINYWCGPNEEILHTAAEMAYYAEVCAEFARLIFTNHPGRAAAIGGWATGTPALDLWPHWVDALQAGRFWDAIQIRHCYGPNDHDNGLRYRDDYAAWVQLGYGDARLVVSEAGADDAGGMHRWRTFYNNDSDRYARELLVPLALEYDQDPYLLGGCIFQCGGPGFDGFNMDQTTVLPILAQLASTPRKDYTMVTTYVISGLDPKLEAAYLAHVQALTADVNQHQRVLPYGAGPSQAWYEQLPLGVLSPQPNARPAVAEGFNLLDANGSPLPLPKRTNNVDLREKKVLPDGRTIFRVVDPPGPNGVIWWVLATQLLPL